MHFIQPQAHGRRAFLRRSAQLALTGTALPTALNLAAMSEAAALTATDYKALVCVFLYGGNDYANTVVTYDNTSYDRYASIRGGAADRTGGGIALAQSALTGTLLNPLTALPNGRQYALHPSMTGLANLFNTGKLAVQLNVGPLVVPLTLAQYKSTNNNLYPKPPKLFSHNDQQSIWQSSSPEGSTQGWGGSLGDLALSANSNSLFTCMSVTGNAVYLSGSSALSYQIGSSGVVLPNAIKNNVYNSANVRQAIATLTQQTRSHVLENEYNRIMQRAVTAGGTLSTAIAATNVTTTFPSGNSLADQLKMVAKLIAARNTLGNKRQVFMVSLGGFDLHDYLISQQSSLLTKVSQAMTAFYNATVELGVADKVTTFTASDFGRTLTSNGDGSDHGWGSHHLVMGGAVKGQAFYGTAPAVTVTTSSATEDQGHVGQGRLLPTTSVDQYAATLAKWFGVNSTEMQGVLPNLQHFGGTDYPLDLGFMTA
jgi:uncharacterized protein (DUF1501 family)